MRKAASFGLCGMALTALVVGCGEGRRGSAAATETDPDAAPMNGASVDAGSSALLPDAAKPSTPGDSTPVKPGTQPTQPGQPLQGATEFVSADDNSGMGTTTPGAANSGAAGAAATAAPPSTPAADGAATSNRMVERGDIYRVLGDQRILNLNSYRGVQVIDISDVSQPRIEGRLAVTGTPVELYVVNDRAIVLLNNWQGYYGSRDDLQVQSVQGGLVLSVDIHDRAHPVLIDQAPVPGNITTSRLTQGDGQAALYIAATNYNGQAEAVVKSFDVSNGKFIAKSELSLGGYVQDIAATTNLLMVASQDFSQNQGRSQVSVIDISRPDGTMLRGGSVLALGTVQNKFNMDAYKGVLRVVSGANWNGTLQNHVETFDLRDLQRLAPLDHCTFGNRSPNGQSEMLYATVFVENRAFFVTYYRRDPFHAFSIDDQGRCAEHNEFIVSGWNDFLSPTLNDTRLIGIGHNDESSTLKLSVSLYDAENLSNPNPLRARADIDLANSYSEATWDDRGFSVLENAVSVKAADGTVETGLVLLPYQGWNQTTQTQVAQVQIFTFSDHTLTKRGSMDHGSSVRRSFMTDASTTANLSEEQLSLFNTADPNAPKELGRVDVAPNYTRVFVFGDYIARLKDRVNNYYYVWAPRNQSVAPPNGQVQIVPRSADPDASAALTAFDVPSGADLVQVGKLLVSVVTTSNAAASGKTPTYHTQLVVHDLSDPTQPKLRGSLETDRIVPSYGGYVLPVATDCFSCGGGYGYRGTAQHYVVGDSLVFLGTQQHNQSLGHVRVCTQYPPPQAWDSSACPASYTFGSVTCTTPSAGKPRCSGGFNQCDPKGNCKAIAAPAGVQESCSEYDQVRYWQSYTFDNVDLRNPDAPSMAPRLELPTNEEGTSVVAAGNTLFVNHRQPYDDKDATLGRVKRFVRAIDFADPQNPQRGEPINIPGDVIAVDGETLYTRDQVWSNNQMRTLLARLTLRDKLAYLQASRMFVDRSVETVKLDGASHILVSSSPATNYVIYCGGSSSPTPPGKLTILDAQSLDVSGETNVDAWATFSDAVGGRALFRVSGGLLVFDVQDATKPKAQAYFATLGWPGEILFDGKDITFAAGPYGVYRFDASVFNLLTK
jgi:hypothetical protein